MSAFSVYLSQDGVVIATDTMLFREVINHEKPNASPVFIPTGFTNKTHLFANYRCCMVCFGYNKTSVSLDEFVNSQSNCTDIEYLVAAIEKRFFNFIDLGSYERVPGDEHLMPGSIQVFAYSRIKKQMVWYLINISWKGLKVIKKDCAIGQVISVPFIRDKEAESEIGKRSDLTIHGALIELMKLQYAESLKSATRTVGIGGEIMITTMLTKPQFSVSFEFPYKFDNFKQVVYGFFNEVYNTDIPVIMEAID